MKVWMSLILTGLAIAGIGPSTLTVSAKDEAPSVELLAIVDDQLLTVESFKSEMARHSGPISNLEDRQSFLEDLVRLELLYSAARQAGYDQDPEIVGTLKRLMVKKFREEVLQPQLAGVKVTDAELENHYRKHRTDFISPKKVRAAVIQIKVSNRASAEQKAKLAQKAAAAREEALKLDPALPTFAAVAARYSDHQATRYRGGDTGWLQFGRPDHRWNNDVIDAIFSVYEPGEVSPVIITDTGHYVIKLIEIQSSKALPYAAVRERVRHQVLKQKRARAERVFYEELKNKIQVWVNPELLQSIPVPGGNPKQKESRPPALPGS